MFDSGMSVTLYTYGDVPNAPPGVEVRDGQPILDRALIERLVPVAKKDQAAWLPTVQFSDFFPGCVSGCSCVSCSISGFILQIKIQVQLINAIPGVRIGTRHFV